jgi:hypothetical protein
MGRKLQDCEDDGERTVSRGREEESRRQEVEQKEGSRNGERQRGQVVEQGQQGREGKERVKDEGRGGKEGK